MNHKTGERVEIAFFPKTGKSEIGMIKGTGYDSTGKATCQIEGNWLREIRLRDISTNQVEILWQEKPMIPDSHLMYFYTRFSMLINWRND